MVRPSNLPTRQSPHVNKLGKIKKAASTKVPPAVKEGGATKKKKKTKKTSPSAPKKAASKKKRMKKVPRAFLEALADKSAEEEAGPVPDTDLDVDQAKIEVVTSAAIKRVATRVGIACISNEASQSPLPALSYKPKSSFHFLILKSPRSRHT